MILFYCTPWCGFCRQAKEALDSEISSKKIKVIDITVPDENGVIPTPPTEATGFPYFVNETNGQRYTHTGWPGTKEKLYAILHYEAFEESVAFVQPIITELHYHRVHGGGYLTLSKCWDKRPEFTA